METTETIEMDSTSTSNPSENLNTANGVNALQAGREDIDTFFAVCTIQDEVKVLSTRVLEYRVMTLSEKEVKLFWTNKTLQSYIECERAPRGLRTFREVSQFQEDRDFVFKWKQAHLDHSLNLLKIVHDRSKQEYDQICNELELAKTELQTRLTDAQWQTLERKVERKLIPIQNDIKERKRDKFMRDKLDYELERVFTWRTVQKPRRPNRGGRNRRPKKPQTEYWTTDSGSDSSATEDTNNGTHTKKVTGSDVATPPSGPLGAGRAEGGEGRKTPATGGGMKRKQVSWR